MTFVKDTIPYGLQSNTGYAGGSRVPAVPLPHLFQPRPGYGAICVCWRGPDDLLHAANTVLAQTGVDG